MLRIFFLHLLNIILCIENKYSLRFAQVIWRFNITITSNFRPTSEIY